MPLVDRKYIDICQDQMFFCLVIESETTGFIAIINGPDVRILDILHSSSLAGDISFCSHVVDVSLLTITNEFYGLEPRAFCSRSESFILVATILIAFNSTIFSTFNSTVFCVT